MNYRAKVIKLSLMLIAMVITLITVTFAWFMVVNKSEPIIIKTGTLRVNATLYYVDEEETEVGSSGIIIADIIPGKEFLFKLSITNNGSIPGSLTVKIMNIIYSEEFMDGVFEIRYGDDETKPISGEEMLLFEEYFLTEKTTYDFFFTVIATGNITSDMISEYIILSKILVQLDQIKKE